MNLTPAGAFTATHFTPLRALRFGPGRIPRGQPDHSGTRTNAVAVPAACRRRSHWTPRPVRHVARMDAIARRRTADERRPERAAWAGRWPATGLNPLTRDLQNSAILFRRCPLPPRFPVIFS